MSEPNPLQLMDRWIPLLDRAIFRISGPDRVRFLNGQVTNDVSGTLEHHAVAACLCSIKGKVEALVWISATEDSLLLDGELGQRDFLLARLERYLIADDCEIHDETGKLLLVHHFLQEAPGAASLRLHSPGRDLYIGQETTIPFEKNREIKKDEYEELSLLAGIPRSGFEITGEEFTAELALDSRAVSFNKGCYLGQEIISRIQSVGRVKRRLRIIRTDEPLLRGDSVENEFEEKGVATRDTMVSANFFNLSMGLFGLGSSSPRDPKNEPVLSRKEP